MLGFITGREPGEGPSIRRVELTAGPDLTTVGCDEAAESVYDHGADVIVLGPLDP